MVRQSVAPLAKIDVGREREPGLGFGSLEDGVKAGWQASQILPVESCPKEIVIQQAILEGASCHTRAECRLENVSDPRLVDP